MTYQTPFLRQAGKEIQGIFTALLSNMGGAVPEPSGVPSKDKSMGGLQGHDPWQVAETPHPHRQCVIPTTSLLAQILTQGHHDPLHR